MTGKQAQHLARMANQIAHNMAAWGDESEVARRTGEHLAKFWTPAMREQLLALAHSGSAEMHPAVILALGELAAGDR
jgi:hypothetical protein